MVSSLKSKSEYRQQTRQETVSIEYGHQVAVIRKVAKKVFAEMVHTVSYKFGKMIEIHRAAVIADELYIRLMTACKGGDCYIREERREAMKRAIGRELPYFTQMLSRNIGFGSLIITCKLECLYVISLHFYK